MVIIPYTTAPKTAICKHPTAKFRLSMIRKSTSGFFSFNSRHKNAINARIRIAVAQRIQIAPNQSSSCPLSKIICSAPSHTASKPSPIASSFPATASRIYFGSTTRREIKITARIPIGILM